ncbi:bifunctional lytic transglycosylase/C40 family peptidase [Nocardiopsis tropica]|uniref:Bifunctional lytic transglycosylase/C40 family peptidase n=1 Tax=Nocardiopsis tropica TaxID=109330 RepID=A0ABU7KTT9_9ACTN|nr:bifunctional lytic transglycosylase/C40 family peptidase [Nocardiopsis umidischolae]MEE2052062.1 bifunctional lytic transglycosylase/C40 family peptidase [Nocardiopsis umidischolae]
MGNPLGCGCALIAVPLTIGLAVSLLGALVEDPHRGAAPDQVDGIHPVLLDAYLAGARALDAEYPQCTGMRWQILAGIGAVESDHAAGSTISPTGDTDPPVVGPVLDGSGVGGNLTPHYDTDGGVWDGDTVYDAAVGVTQHLPANWDDYGVDGNGDGRADPHNVFDSVAATAVELCASHPDQQVDFTDREDLEDALFRYNHADWYVDDVLAEIDAYTAAHPGTGIGGGPGSEAGRTAAQWALDQVGKPYVWGGTGPDGFDCSGLTMRAWEAAGVAIPRVTTDQFNAGTRVPLDQLQPGDLLFYDTRPYAPGDPPTHVTMYVGDGQMANAPSSGQTVRVEPVDGPFYTPRFMGAVRPSSTGDL